MSEILATQICIIGGGIAGNYLASLLAKDGLAPVVIEEHTEIGKPFQCAGIVSQKLLKLIDVPDNLILNRVRRANIISPNLQTITMGGKERPLVIDRVEFDRHFYLEAKQDGAIYLLGEKAQSFQYLESSQGVAIQTTKRTIHCKILVAADGPHSLVARAFNLSHKTIFGIQQRVRYQHDLDSVSMYFNPKWKELFAWIIPEGDGICRIGLGGEKNPISYLKTLKKSLGIKEADVLDTQGGNIPIGLPNQVAFPHILLVGDSASMVKATTGGGIVMLINAGQIAARCIQKSLKTRDMSYGFLKKHYELPVRRTVGYNLKVHYFVRRVLMRFTAADFNYFFRLYQNETVKHTIGNEVDMDYLTKVIPKLLRNPHLIKFMIYLMIRNLDLVPEFFRLLVR